MMNRIEVRKTIQASGNDFYESLPEGPLQHLAGDIMGHNEEYVLNHSGYEETVGTLSILRDGFTTNQKNWLRDLKTIVEAEMSNTYNIPPTREEIKKRGAVGWCRVGYDIYIARGMTKKDAWEGAFMHTCKHAEQIMRELRKQINRHLEE